LKEIGKLITKYPKVLGQDVSKDLHRTIMLLENMGISFKDAKRLIVRDPTFFTNKARKETWAPHKILTTNWNPKKTHWQPHGMETCFT
jgi:hypothetical protein